MVSLQARFEGCLLGLAIGDALGMPVENWARGTFTPVSGMRAGGVFSRAAGTWTDDTAMALCLAESLLRTSGFDAVDQMNRYSQWARGELLGDTGTNMDIGGTVADALARYQQDGDPYAGSTEPESAGNGCIMRLAPIPMFYHSNQEVAERYAALSSRTTHQAVECIDASRLLARTIWRALQGMSKDEVLFADRDTFSGATQIVSIADGRYAHSSESDIQGTGYVVASLEAALWCFHQSDTFSGAVLKAVNLGDDADTTAAVCGQVAGAYHGIGGVPNEWLEQLLSAPKLRDVASGLLCQRAKGI